MSALGLAEAELTDSRARLRAAMQAIVKPPPRVSNSDSGSLRGAKYVSWFDRLRFAPAVSLMVSAVNSWWIQHPLHLASVVAQAASRAVVQPIAEKAPIRLVLGAAALGGVIAWSKPWRWVGKPAVLAGLYPLMMSRVMPHAPTFSWTKVLMSLVEGQPKPDRAAKPV